MSRSSAHLVKVDIIASTKQAEADLVRLGITADGSARAMGDAFEKGGHKAGGAMSKLGNTLGNFGVPFSGSIEKVAEKFKEVETSGKGFGKAMAELGKVSILAIGAAAVEVGAEALKMGESFQTSTNTIAIHAGISTRAASAIGSAFLSTGSDVLQSGQQMADAYGPVAGIFTSLYGHALDAKDALTVMTAAGALADATGTDLTTTTAALSQVMAAYNIPVKDAAATTDQLLNISRATGSPLADLATAMGRLHARLGVAAPTLADTGALIEALGHQGLTGSRGTLVAATAFSTLEAGSKATKKTIGELGLSVYNSAGKFVGMSSVIAQLRPKLAGMTDAQKELTLKTLFGASAAQVMGGIVAQGPAKFDALTASINKSGTAHQASALYAKSLKGEEELVKKSVENLGTKLGTDLIPVLQQAIGVTMKVVTWFEKHKAAAEVLAGVIGSVLAVAIAAYVAKLAWAAGESVVKFAKMIASGAKWVAENAANMAKAAARFAVYVAEHAVQAAVWIGQNVAMAAAATAAFIAENAASLGIVAGIALVVAGIVYLGTHWKQIWGDITRIAGDAWHWITSHLKLISLAFGPLGFAIYELGHHWKQIWGDITAAVRDAYSTIKPIIGAISSIVSGVGGAISGLFGGGSKSPSIHTKIGKRALGGPVTSGSTYLVGERGAELFTPGSNGMILANASLSATTPSRLSAGGATSSSTSFTHSSTVNIIGTTEQQARQFKALLDEWGHDITRKVSASVS